MAFTPFVDTDQPTMAEFNEKFQECIAEAFSHDVQIETGSYVGTGTNSITINFSNPPKIVFIFGVKANSYFSAWILFNGSNGFAVLDLSNSSMQSYTYWLSGEWTGNQVTIGGNAAVNINVSGYTYLFYSI